ncbi:MAG: ABC transporter permease [Xanthomonadales bacterium]|nr:ABC transporter permease [Xanthomonadales bacterium]
MKPAVEHLLLDMRQALGQLAHHRLRTALTLLGMIFGVGAVIAMLAVSEGGKREALELIEGMGLRNLIVEDRELDSETLKEVRKYSAGLNVRDAESVTTTLPFVENWAGGRQFRTWTLFSREGQSRAGVIAVSPDFFDLTSLSAGRGRLFNETEDQSFAQVAVLGSAAARDLFPNGDAVGKHVKVNHLWLEVIGVLEDRQLSDSQFEGREIGGEADNVYLPLQTGLARLKREELSSELDTVKLRLDGEIAPGTAASAIEHLLNRRHGDQNDYQIVVPARLLAQHQQTQQIFTIVMSAVAGISLLVGGIGIMNIMLASVMERKSEIGLLRAVGARETDIIRQFLVEATVIALIGAGVGVLLGVVLAYTIAAFAGWAVAWSLLVMVVAVLVCMAIAVGFGVYPAVSAARMDPVLALQSD